VLSAYNVPKKQNAQGKYSYDLSVIIESLKAEKDK